MGFTFGGTPVTLKGKQKKVGDKAENFRAIAPDMSVKTLDDFDEETIVISAVPSIDTSVCSYQTLKFNQALEAMEDVAVITISNDLPFAQKRWCEKEEGMEDIHILSDHKDLDFAQKYGTLMEEFRLQARTVFILDADRTITYVERVGEGSDHPDYDAVIAKLKK